MAARRPPGTGRYPLWGLTYYRWWLADRLVETVPVYLLTGSALHPPGCACWARASGQVVLGSTTMRVPHLVSIGAGTSMGNGVNLENARVEGGRLHLGHRHRRQRLHRLLRGHRRRHGGR
jgi:hypothetical protein